MKETALMPFPQAKPLHVSPLQHELLQRMVQRTTSAQRLVKRGHIILEAAQGMSNTQIAAHQLPMYAADHLRTSSRIAEFA